MVPDALSIVTAFEAATGALLREAVPWVSGGLIS